MAEYVTRPGGYDLSLAGPYSNRSANMQVHVLNAKHRRLRETLDRYLNPFAPPGGRYIPIGDRVVLSCVDIKEGRAGDESLGSMHEIDVAFFIPALYCDPWPLPKRIVALAPYLFVNNTWGMVMGREVHGFRKDIATSFATGVDVDGPDWSHLAGDIEHVDAWAMPEKGGDSRLARMRLVEIRGPEDRTPVAQGDGGLIKALIGSGITELPVELAGVGDPLDLGQLKHTVAGLLGGLVRGRGASVSMVFLRQFRDPRQSQQTDVQEIIEAASSATLTSGPSVLRRSEVQFHHAASHPIANELGLPNDEWIRADLSLELNLDFVFHDAAR